MFSPIKESKRDIYTHFLLHIYFVQWFVKEIADSFFFFFLILKPFHSVWGKQQKRKFNVVVEFMITFKS